MHMKVFLAPLLVLALTSCSAYMGKPVTTAQLTPSTSKIVTPALSPTPMRVFPTSIPLGDLNLLGISTEEMTLLPPAKQTAVALNEAVRATDLALPQASKPPVVQPFSLPASCPAPTQITGIGPFRFGPFFQQSFINVATALASTGDYYTIWAGAPDDAPQKGLLRVDDILADSCRSYALGTLPPPFVDYVTPQGPLTITQIQGDTIIYSIAGGGTGRFNFVTGQFLP